MRNLGKRKLSLLFAFLLFAVPRSAQAECQMDACVECYWSGVNGRFWCKIVWNNRYCDCDSGSGGSCYQNGTCKVVVENQPSEPQEATEVASGAVKARAEGAHRSAD